MAVVMAPPAMPVMMVSNFDHNLRTRCRDQRHEKHKSQKSEAQLLHDVHGIPPLITVLRFCYPNSSNSRKQPNSSRLELGQVRHRLQQAKPTSGNDDGGGCTSNDDDAGVQLRPQPERSLQVPAARGT